MEMRRYIRGGVMAPLNLCVIAMMVSAVTSFVTPTSSTSVISGGVVAESSRSYTKSGVTTPLSATDDAEVESSSKKS
eukprot:scaffold19129_cov167-Skeletonema_dohrnii-CCMP3373.AAC.2